MLRGSIEPQDYILVGIIKQQASLSGRIYSNASLSGRMRSSVNLVGSLHLSEDYESYKGSYSVTPKIGSQILDVSDKKMNEDILINPIPYFEVSNEKGKTVIIGG